MVFVPSSLSTGILGVAAMATILASAVAQIAPQPADSSVATYGVGGLGAGDIKPHLTTNGLPRVGSLGFKILAEDVVGGTWGMMLFSFAGQDVPLPGIGRLYVQGWAIWPIPFVADGSPGVPGAGTASIPFPIPHLKPLIGIPVHIQGFFADKKAASSGGVSHSPGLKLTLTYPRLAIGSAWRNLDVGPTSETVISTVSLIPNSSRIEGLITFSQGGVAKLADAAVILRFSKNGVIEALDGDTWRSVAVLPYASGRTYEFRIVVDVPRLTFDAYVTPSNQAPVQIADTYAFNKAAAPVVKIGKMGLQAAVGSFDLLEFFPQLHSNYKEVTVKTAYAWTPGGSSGGTVINLTPTPNEGWYGAACIHPKGKDVIFPGAAWGYSRIWKYTFATKKIVPLTSDAFVSNLPSYSANGNSIVFGSDKDLKNPRFDMFEVGRSRADGDGFQGGLTRGSSLYVMDADGSNIRRITFGGDDILDKRPSFSPDGRTIVFQSSRAPNPLNTLYMWTVPTDGSGPPSKVSLTGNPWIGRPRYSVDGTEIFFFTGVTNGKYDVRGRHTLCRVAVSGGAWSPVANDTVGGGSHGPDPDPDGKHLWYHAYANGLWGIYRLPLSSVGNPVRFGHSAFRYLHTAHATAASNGSISFDSRSYVQFP